MYSVRLYTLYSERSEVRSGGKRAVTTESTRRAIIAAARDLLAERRWQDFTVEAVANRAGVTRVTVYNQVHSKAGLLRRC